MRGCVILKTTLCLDIFRGHVWAYMKGNEMLFQIIYLYMWYYGCGFGVIQVKASKFIENDNYDRGTESQEEFQMT